MTKLLLSIVLFGLSFLGKEVYAAECITSNSSMPESQLQEIKQACESQISTAKSTVNTLKQVIATFNSKINLAQVQINQTQAQVNSLEKEINVLDGVLDTVNQSTSELTQIYLARVREAYRRSRVDQTNLIFSAESFSDYFMKLKYLNTVKAKDQLILTELENARQDYDHRKQDKVTKQQEIEKLKSKLVTQQKVLLQQQKDKQNLLSLTQNDQRKFEALLKQADDQIAAFKKFTSGATSLSNQTHCDSWGCYFSQRDSKWFDNTIGNSPEIIGEVGCLITSSAMVASHYGKDITPLDIARSSAPFLPPDTAYMISGGWRVNGVNVNRLSIWAKKSTKDPDYTNNQTLLNGKIDDAIKDGKPIIIGLNTSVGSTHFIVIKGKKDNGYIMNDPFMENGYDKLFSNTYSLGQIFNVDKVTVN